jgi:ribosomal protein S27AE
MIDLPPGVSLSDVDGSDECPQCGGYGAVMAFYGHWVHCKSCGGTGKKPKIEKEEDDDR